MNNTTELELDELKNCSSSFVLAIADTMNAINGKWKLPIIASLLFGKKRFKELAQEITKITPRMLSKELKDLEMNGIVTRTVYNSTPVIVEYKLTKSGESFKIVLETMIEWGLQHRENMIRNY